MMRPRNWMTEHIHEPSHTTQNIAVDRPLIPHKKGTWWRHARMDERFLETGSGNWTLLNDMDMSSGLTGTQDDTSLGALLARASSV